MIKIHAMCLKKLSLFQITLVYFSLVTHNYKGEYKKYSLLLYNLLPEVKLSISYKRKKKTKTDIEGNQYRLPQKKNKNIGRGYTFVFWKIFLLCFPWPEPLVLILKTLNIYLQLNPLWEMFASVYLCMEYLFSACYLSLF